jgi:site-specific recombinase XerD
MSASEQYVITYVLSSFIIEAVRLKVKDIDFEMKQLAFRSGKADKDRLTTFPMTVRA